MTQIDIGKAITDTGCQEYGFSWSGESVQEQAGPNGSDRAPVNTAAQIAIMTDVEKFHQAFPGYLVAMADGTSLRVSCQRIGRKFSGKDIPGNRKAVVDHLTGVRVRTTSAVRRSLPNGQVYTGTNEVEFRQLYAAALVDSGVDGNIAAQIARTIGW